MSFRGRLTTFFVLIVVVPTVALGVVVARLVTDSERGKADARASAYGAAAMRFYERAAALGARAAGRVGADRTLIAAVRAGDRVAAERRARALMRTHGLARLVVVVGDRRGGRAGGRPAGSAPPRPFLDLGSASAVAAGSARVQRGRAVVATVEASTVGATALVTALSAPDVALIVRRGETVLASSLPGPPAAARAVPRRGAVTHRGVDYAVTSFHAADLDGAHETITVLADASATAAAGARNRRVAFALLVGFLALAVVGAVLVSRQLHRQVGRFLVAARRLGGGDFSTPVPVHGRDEFAQLGREFNRMSAELERRIEELRRERARLRDSIERVGETFASNPDRRALLALGVDTAVAAVEATCGRATAADRDRAAHAAGDPDAPDDAAPAELVRVGDVEPLATLLADAEARARATGAPAAVATRDAAALACPLPRAGDAARPHGVVAVARHGRPFDLEEQTLLASLAAQTGISLENVELHDHLARQAVPLRGERTRRN